MNNLEIVGYLVHLCEDFENQGDHFEFTNKDAEVIAKAIALLVDIQHGITKALIALGIAAALGVAVYLNYKVCA